MIINNLVDPSGDLKQSARAIYQERQPNRRDLSKILSYSLADIVEAPS